jgi:hypothetical protein
MGTPICAVCSHPRRADIEFAIASGDTDSSIGKTWNLNPRGVTIHRLKHLPLTPMRMAPGERAHHEAKLREVFVSSKVERLRKLQSVVDRLEAMFEARAAELSHLTGGATGLIVLRQKGVGSGSQFQLVEEAVFDSSAVAEYRAALRQAAEEMGQWDPSGTADRAAEQQGGGGVTIHQVIGGSVAQAVVADPRPGAKPQQIQPPAAPTIRSILAGLPQDSTHSLVRDTLPAIDREQGGDG